MNGGPQMNFRQPNQKTTESKETKTAGQRKYRKENCILHCMCRYLWCCFRNMFQGVRYVTNRFLPTTTSSTTKLQSTTDGRVRAQHRAPLLLRLRRQEPQTFPVSRSRLCRQSLLLQALHRVRTIMTCLDSSIRDRIRPVPVPDLL